MPLTVLNVGYPLAPVSPSTAGGAEQILGMLDEALTQAGHRSVVVAPEGSRCRGVLLPTPAVRSVLDTRVHEFVCAKVRSVIRCALRRFSVDVVHLHGIDFLDYLPESGPPVVVTLHLPPGWYPLRVFTLQPPRVHLVCVSRSQAAQCPAAAHTRIIENGIRVDRFQPSSKKGRYVVALGRVCPEKGFHLAVDAANKCGLPLILAGSVFDYAAHREYFQNVLRPRLSSPHRFIGAVGFNRKRSLLSGARCLVLPSLVPETSSLVAMEASASGTPVVATRQGALAEIVEDGRTGFLVDTPAELSDAILASCELNPAVCRQSAVERFSADRMIAGYFDLYRELLDSSSSVTSEARVAA